MRKLGLLFLFLAMPVLASAENENFYWGVMLGKTEYQDPALDASLLTGTGRFGWELFRYLAVEGRVAATTGEDVGSLTDLRLDYLGSALAKVMLPLGKEKKVNLYAIAGISAYKISYDNLGTTTYFTDEAVSYGVGIEMFADGVNGLNFEWVRYADEDNSGSAYTLDNYSIGYIRRF